jgi:hypothetical protein
MADGFLQYKSQLVQRGSSEADLPTGGKQSGQALQPLGVLGEAPLRNLGAFLVGWAAGYGSAVGGSTGEQEWQSDR